MAIKAIFFDAGNTLIFIDPRLWSSHPPGTRAEVDVEGSGRPSSTPGPALSGGWRRGPGEPRTRSGRSTSRTSSGLRGAGGPARGRGRTDHGGPSGTAPLDLHGSGTPAALDRLLEAGYRLAVISNADGRVEGLIEDAGIRDRFEFVMDSEMEGVEKPDPEIFLRACRRMGVDPAESLYVGDLYPVDVLGARKAGLQAVLLDPQRSLDYPVDRLPDVAALPAYMDRLSRRP